MTRFLKFNFFKVGELSTYRLRGAKKPLALRRSGVGCVYEASVLTKRNESLNHVRLKSTSLHQLFLKYFSSSSLQTSRTMSKTEFQLKLKTVEEYLALITEKLRSRKVKEELTSLEKEMRRDTFWEDSGKATMISQKQAYLSSLQDRYKSLQISRNNIFELASLAFDPDMEDEGDKQVIQDCVEELQEIETKARRFTTELLLDGPVDHASCFIEITAGVGGTESCELSQMLLGMYKQLAVELGYNATTLEANPGQEAGVRSAVLKINGLNAFGWLRTEAGVHRMVTVLPLVEDGPAGGSANLGITIDRKDLKIDTFRSSGPGGQHANVTDSAVRVTHLPTGIIVSCQNERSQHQNRSQALQILHGKLLQRKIDERRSDQRQLRSEIGQANFGNQTRSYVLHPYKLVKDHRTGVEGTNPEAVFKGERDAIFPFIEAALLKAV